MTCFAFIGRWGGIFEIPKRYTLSSGTAEQTDVQLVKKFDDWEPLGQSIMLRVPWVNGAILSTSLGAKTGYYGTITGISASSPCSDYHIKLYVWHFKLSIDRVCSDISTFQLPL